ncbi:sigma factor-like helix-turn-helix DNA-binding protein [Cytobacillus sp. FSL H8-0458]|uniref:sigma factor-like helix-turn-helix DNA-binding protein n=1 Tax=Cytobacillus sp. FSL H8-0458 TaxID=2975346 RepID=UPI0030F76D39
MNHVMIRTNFNKETLQKLPQVLTLYYQYELTLGEVAKALNMSSVTVSKLLKQYGTGLRPKKAYDEKVNKLGKVIEIMYYEQMKSSNRIASILGISSEFVVAYLNRYAKGTRSASEACILRADEEYREKIRETQLGESNTAAKLTTEKVVKIRNEYVNLLSEGHRKTHAQNYLAKKYGVKRPTVSDIVLRKTWRHI